MTTERRFLRTSRLATAALLATGVAASSIALNSGHEIVPAAAAQSAAATGGEGAAKEFVDGHDSAVTQADHDAMRLLGTTHERLRSQVGDTANSASGVFEEYQHAMSSGNLDRAAEVLAIASNKPVTEDLVLDLNDTLGVESALSAQQVAAEAASRQSARVQLGEGTMSRKSAGPMSDHFTHTAGYRNYEDAMERGNLERAAEALAGATQRPITESFVLEVNRDLGIESSLTAQQVAEAASAKQRMK